VFSILWLGFALCVTLLAAVAIIGVVWTGDWIRLLGVPVSGLLWYWLVVGAWRRTTWHARSRPPAGGI